MAEEPENNCPVSKLASAGEETGIARCFTHRQRSFPLHPPKSSIPGGDGTRVGALWS
jgi:hypothetical protein